jgi:hypothetical protein
MILGMTKYAGVSAQEKFALEMSGYKADGFYVELGAFHSKDGSNTYYLEKDYGWSGVSFEIVEEKKQEFISNRKNPCFGDALQFDYLSYFEINQFPKQIDYLQVDIDAGYDEHIKPLTPYTTLLGLISLPLTQYRFNVIVFEHDVNMYWRMKPIRDAQREILDGLGYTLIWKEEHEDWWIDCSAIDHQLARRYFYEN